MILKTEEVIKEAFDPYINVPLEAWESFVGHGEVISISKEQTIKEAGATEKYLYFILKGCGGILLWNNHNFVCVDLCFEGDFFGDYMSFLNQQPSPLTVISFESSSIFRISKSNFDKLNESEPGLQISRFAAEALFMHKQKQQIDILTKTSAERYQELQSLQPEILQRTPQKYIASYLGITPQSLSRIRNELAGKS